MTAYSAFDLQGTDAQNTIIKQAVDRITFPWEKITAIRKPIPVGWRDLNGGSSMRFASLGGDLHDETKIPDHVHVVGPNGEEGHGVARFFDAKDGEGARWWTAGVFWWGGGSAGIDIDVRCEAQPGIAREVFSAEAAHFADLGMPYTPTMKDQITRLLHPGGLDDHTYWWPEDVGLPYGGQPYFACMGETNMGLWTHAYSDMTPYTEPFPHKSTRAMAPEVHRILGAPPVGASPAPPTEIRLTGRSWITTYGNGRVELLWTDARGDTLTVRRNDVNWITTANDGRLVSNLATRRGTFRYQLVDRGGRKSNIAVVTL